MEVKGNRELKRTAGKSKKITRTDLILLVAILAVCAVFALAVRFLSEEGRTVTVSLDGVIVETLPMDRDVERTIRSAGGINIVQIKDRQVSVTEADCPDKICVKHSAISKVGETIVCLPHRLVVEIGGGDE